MTVEPENNDIVYTPQTDQGPEISVSTSTLGSYSITIRAYDQAQNERGSASFDLHVENPCSNAVFTIDPTDKPAYANVALVDTFITTGTATQFGWSITNSLAACDYNRNIRACTDIAGTDSRVLDCASGYTNENKKTNCGQYDIEGGFNSWSNCCICRGGGETVENQNDDWIQPSP